MILILTTHDDLHALEVQRQVRAAGHAGCHIIECDRIAQRAAVSFEIGRSVRTDRVLTSEGLHVAISDACVLWFRTTSGSQQLVSPIEDKRAVSIVNNDCRGALAGLFATHFSGKWISTPDATYRASDKIGQVEAARACGWRVPRTLVTQSRDAVIEFFESCGGSIVAKTVAGAPGPFLETVKLVDPRAFDEDTFAAAPTIFQEYIAGHEHIRLNSFGEHSYAAVIDTAALDWRRNLNVPIRRYSVPGSLHRQVRLVLDALQLEMGIVDLKLTPKGEPVWLEVNPQGQFLFLDALADLHLVENFATYLLVEHERALSGGASPTERKRGRLETADAG
jgi:glutathione synthase/RimK-type ligase-like ATP-grasp enzyme